MLEYSRSESQLLWYEPSQLSGLEGINQSVSQSMSRDICVPQSMDGPRVGGPCGRVTVPELRLQQHAARCFKATGVIVGTTGKAPWDKGRGAVVRTAIWTARRTGGETSLGARDSKGQRDGQGSN